MLAVVSYVGRFNRVNKYRITLDSEAKAVVKAHGQGLLQKCGVKLTLDEVEEVKQKIAALGIEVKSGSA